MGPIKTNLRPCHAIDMFGSVHSGQGLEFFQGGGNVGLSLVDLGTAWLEALLQTEGGASKEGPCIKSIGRGGQDPGEPPTRSIG